MLKAKSRIVSLLTAGLSAVLALVLGIATLHIQPKTVSATEAQTETMSIIANAGNLSSDKLSISWTSESGNVMFVNEKAESTTAIRTDDNDHFRLYANSSFTVSVSSGNITKIVITCTNSSYATACVNSVGSEAVADGSVVTITPTASADTYTCVKATAQIRLNAIEVTYEGAAEADPEIQAAVDNVKSYMSLSYTYTQETVDKPIAFEFGENGAESHADGTKKTEYNETNGDYTLTLTDITNMYTGARDAKGNSCIKLGSSSDVGGFSFTVEANVEKVIIAVAKYKANTTKINVNGTDYTLTKNSNDGEYDVIEVDTLSTEIVTLTTVSGGVRAMINSITYVADNAGETEKVTVLKDSEVRIRCGIDASLKAIEGITEYGICVTAGKTVNYTTDATSWNEESDPFYVVISLGDIINNMDKVKMEFTVQAYVVGNDGLTYKSASVKTYSVATMIAEYKELGYDVEHLYNYLQKNGAFEEVA